MELCKVFWSWTFPSGRNGLFFLLCSFSTKACFVPGALRVHTHAHLQIISHLSAASNIVAVLNKIIFSKTEFVNKLKLLSSGQKLRHQRIIVIKLAWIEPTAAVCLTSVETLGTCSCRLYLMSKDSKHCWHCELKIDPPTLFLILVCALNDLCEETWWWIFRNNKLMSQFEPLAVFITPNLS